LLVRLITNLKTNWAGRRKGKRERLGLNFEWEVFIVHRTPTPPPRSANNHSLIQ
jgi:hypothetical protein